YKLSIFSSVLYKVSPNIAENKGCSFFGYLGLLVSFFNSFSVSLNFGDFVQKIPTKFFHLPTIAILKLTNDECGVNVWI
ncbi:MAG: hypothetical protein ABF779_10430, partial [Liquorilactobacillus nagelii]|uniref:hypothetical protein n=1 Tax=Liquorilactobacillus nagelii TaxID=82688 RepID=UPI0039EB71CB